MKKVLAILLSLVAFAYAQDIQSVVAATAGNDNTPPANVSTISLTNSNVAETSDTLATTEYNVYGPYDLSAGGGFMVKGFAFNCPVGTVASGDSLILKYAITATNAIADSVAYDEYVAVDTVDGADGLLGTYVDLSSKVGNYIWFQIYNMDATEAQISKSIKVSMKRDEVKNR